MMHFAHLSDQYSENMMNGFNNMTNGFGCFGMGNLNSPLQIFIAVSWLIFWTAIILLIILSIIYLFKKISGVSLKTENAINILKEKYAKGEISKEEFEQKKKDLEN